MKTDTLRTLCAIHATPGDEADLFDALERRWRAQRLDVRRLGRYAILAEPGERKKSDTLLLIAHADSPGFSVTATRGDDECEVIPLGGIHHSEAAELTLKASDGFHAAHLAIPPRPSAPWLRHLPLRVTLPRSCPTLRKGDRLCWAPFWEERDGLLTTPFLDDRAACALLADWYDRHVHLLAPYNVILAATAMEEITGFGANVLAHAVRADAVLALDVTYEAPEQDVLLGRGPVITLSDASCILPPTLRDRLLAADVPLQTEVYNRSGTDARAFPAQGSPIPVIPLLLPTRGNHGPRETLALDDLRAWPAAISAIANTLFEPRA